MKITAEEIKASYRRMSDGELLALNRGELTDVASQCYDREIECRGLRLEPEAAEAPPPSEEPHEPDEPMIVVGTSQSVDEAREMQGTLEAADIRAGVKTIDLGPGLPAFQVLVPASLADDARQLLNASTVNAIIVPARFENGVFRPLEEVEIPEGTVVEVHVPADAMR